MKNSKEQKIVYKTELEKSNQGIMQKKSNKKQRHYQVSQIF